MGLSDAPTYLADDPAGVCERGSQGRLAPVRLDVAPRRCSTAVCGHIIAFALSDAKGKPGVVIFTDSTYAIAIAKAEARRQGP
ncbi:hypothetical protein J2W42_002981 [Rhizobium tibeticum]|nr:hypothetical protein [Rhizobium tibeticum]